MKTKILLLVVVVFFIFGGHQVIGASTEDGDILNPEDPIETTNNIFITCTNTGQLCNPPYTLRIVTNDLLQAQYSMPTSHCSSMRLLFYLDGVLKVTTGFLGWYGAPAPFDQLPLDTGLIDLGPVSAGPHILKIKAQGQKSGCNYGNVISWGGTLKTYTTAPLPVGGAATGLSPSSVICQNITTGQKISITSHARTWDCEAGGLVVNSGDKIRQTVTGAAD